MAFIIVHWIVLVKKYIVALTFIFETFKEFVCSVYDLTKSNSWDWEKVYTI